MSIQTTHVGSLPRPKNVVDILFKIENGESVDYEKAEKVFRDETIEVLKKQKDAGISIPSDGELSKISYATYIGRRVSGFSGDSPRRAPKDLQDYPSYLTKLANSGGTPTYKRPMCVEKLGAYQPSEVRQDIARLKHSMQATGYRQAFMNSASPGVIALFQPSSYYSSYEDYLSALGDVMKAEYKEIVDSGLYLQIDAPDLGLGRHMAFKELSDQEFLGKASLHIEVLNAALSGLPKDRVRLHICWGNYEGPHHCDIEVDKLFNELFKLQVGALLFEGANPRHEHEWESWKSAPIPDDLILIPGAVDSTTNFIEHPKLVAQRLRRYVDIVGAERVIGGTDCGFSTFAGFGAVDEEIAYAKLKSLSQGAAMVGTP